MFRFKGYFESYLIFNTRKSLSMLLWEGHRPQLLPINLRTHARARQPTHPSSLSQAGPTPRQSDVGQVNRMTLARWSGGTQKKKKKQRRRRRKREDSLGGRAWYASALLTRKRSRVAPASPLPQPAATGVGREAPWRWDPHTVVVVAPTGQWQWPGSLARCDATRRWRCGSFFFFFHFFTAPRRRTRWSVSAGDWASIWLFYYGGVFACIFSFFTVIRRRRRGGGIRRDRVWTFARRSLFARRRWVVNVPDSYVSGLTYIDDRTSTKLYTTMVLLLQRS